ncbi:hypothetical protein J5J83_08190 [Azoarcus sp. L1K30]|uniref:hypothetical protein n=1 Tax=Azoarcus sp. L1K30 TaxID=2820277 RepID=UPI001B812728|nr:hypothetical protein [Azoarcus sp. L1K30]MBR0566093.1 hypothetical protein [Azoarcus sp. L1K30]
MKKVAWWTAGVVSVSVVGYAFVDNARLPYGDHIVVATNLMGHAFPKHPLISRFFLLAKKDPNCRLVGTANNAMISIENGRLQFLMAAWEREIATGWKRKVDRNLLRSMLYEAIAECDPNSFSKAIGPFRPLTYAILSRDTDLVEKLLDRGADPMLRIDTPGRRADGVNLIEFAEITGDKLTSSDDVESLNRIIWLMRSHVISRKELRHK